MLDRTNTIRAGIPLIFCWLYHAQWVSMVVLTLLLTGCGDGRPVRVPISGKVLIDGKPLTSGTICIIPDNARKSAGRIGPDGRFTMRCFDKEDGVVLGTHTVTVTSCDTINDRTRRWNVPKKYSDADSSELSVTIDGPDDNLTIKISWDGDKPFTERYLNGQWQ